MYSDKKGGASSPVFLLVKESALCYNADIRLSVNILTEELTLSGCPIAGIKRETGERPVQPPLLLAALRFCIMPLENGKAQNFAVSQETCRQS